MNTRVIKALVAYAGTLVLLASCSMGGDDYYPMKQGRVLSYRMARVATNAKKNEKTESKFERTFQEERDSDGRKVVPVKQDGERGTSYIFVVKEQDGFYVHGVQGVGEEKPEIFATKRYFIRFPIEEGKGWEYESNIYIVKEKFPVTMKCTIRSLNDMITVPSGTYKRCLKTSCIGVTEKSYPLIGQIKFTKETTDWFAPGTGWVKEDLKEECSLDEIGRVTVSYELVATR